MNRICLLFLALLTFPGLAFAETVVIEGDKALERYRADEGKARVTCRMINAK